MKALHLDQISFVDVTRDGGGEVPIPRSSCRGCCQFHTQLWKCRAVPAVPRRTASLARGLKLEKSRFVIVVVAVVEILAADLSWHWRHLGFR